MIRGEGGQWNTISGEVKIKNPPKWDKDCVGKLHNLVFFSASIISGKWVEGKSINICSNPTWIPCGPQVSSDPQVVPTRSPCGPQVVPKWSPSGPHVVPKWSPTGTHVLLKCAHIWYPRSAWFLKIKHMMSLFSTVTRAISGTGLDKMDGMGLEISEPPSAMSTALRC